jgi:hypothetical protein
MSWFADRPSLRHAAGVIFKQRTLQFLQNKKLQQLIVDRTTSVPDVILEIRCAGDVSEMVQPTPGTQLKEQSRQG